jgi:glycosyltransferase involved in cell wall biosynthesis
MAVRNGGWRLKASLESVLTQDSTSFEFVVVDDGSTDGTSDMLAGFAARDERIVLLHGEACGLTEALIRGCDASRGDFIARQDCGDHSLPGRFLRQLALLKKHIDVGFVSCHTRYVGPGGEYLFLSDSKGIRDEPFRMISDDQPPKCVCGPSHHGSVIFRRNLYEKLGGYRKIFRRSQDWDLWYRMAEVSLFAVVPEVLYEAVVLPDGISMGRKNEQDIFGKVAIEAMQARQSGQTEDGILKQIPLSLVGENSTADGNYFIGSLLFRNRDPRCRRYLLSSTCNVSHAAPALAKCAASLFF